MRALAIGTGRLACGARAPIALTAAAGGLLLSGCGPLPNVATTQASLEAQPDRFSASVVNRAIADRFPGATLLGETEFAEAVVGHLFRYHLVGTDIVVERPKEIFSEGGQFHIRGLRTVSYGTYSIDRGIVSIACANCRYPFLDLGWDRIFFRHEGRLLMATANGAGNVVELIPEP